MRVNIVIGSVKQPYSDVLYRIVGLDTVDHRLPKPILYRRDVFTRNVTTDVFIDKFKPFTDRDLFVIISILLEMINRSNFKTDIRKFTTSTSLLLVYFPVLDRLGNRLPIGNLWLTHIGLYFEFRSEEHTSELQSRR